MNALAKATEKTGYTIASYAVDSNKDKTSARMHIALEGKNVLKLILKNHGKVAQLMFLMRAIKMMRLIQFDLG